MALTKGIENIYGASFNYHKISDVKIVVSDNGIQLRIIVDSFVDKDARKAGKKPVRTENIIEGADFALTPFYMLLKAKFGDFADATDDFDDAWKNKVTPQVIYTQQTPQGELLSKYREPVAQTESTTTQEEQDTQQDTAATSEEEQSEQTAPEESSTTEATTDATTEDDNRDDSDTTDPNANANTTDTADDIALDVAAEQTTQEILNQDPQETDQTTDQSEE